MSATQSKHSHKISLALPVAAAELSLGARARIMKRNRIDPKHDPIKPLSLDELITALPKYFKTLLAISRRPVRFVRGLNMQRRDALRQAMFFFGVAVAFTFLLMTPAYVAAKGIENSVTKLEWAITLFLRFALYAVLLHLLLHLLGARTSKLRHTFTVYAYLQGVFTPTKILLLYPVLWLLGPDVLFGTPKDLLPDIIALMQHPFFLCYLVFTLFGILTVELILSVVWFSETHQVSRTRCFLSILVVWLVLIPVMTFLVNSMEPWLKKVVERWQ
jgi:hypothetical protein